MNAAQRRMKSPMPSFLFLPSATPEKTGRRKNHLFNLTHRGYSAIENGVSASPYSFYQTWADDPEKAKEICESLTRTTPEQPLETYTNRPLQNK
ncbi:hypothetical protein QS257_17895 [Terrilactibacillus sp. S3-3]|nr:hypothetical protein QS257_17895 [Terrilactibacillus sp. S3-3]